MEQFASKLRLMGDGFDGVDLSSFQLPPAAESMREAAIMWSKVCLQEFRDELLLNGLLLSVAVADFLAELEGSITNPQSRRT